MFHNLFFKQIKSYQKKDISTNINKLIEYSINYNIENIYQIAYERIQRRNNLIQILNKVKLLDNFK